MASVHHPDFVAHDESASQNLDSEPPLGTSLPGLFSALDWFNRLHRTHRAGVLNTFCTKNCCSTMTIVKLCSRCLNWDAISAGKFCWFASGKEPLLFSKDKSMATWVPLRVSHPSLAPSGLVLGIKLIHRSFVFHLRSSVGNSVLYVFIYIVDEPMQAHHQACNLTQKNLCNIVSLEHRLSFSVPIHSIPRVVWH